MKINIKRYSIEFGQKEIQYDIKNENLLKALIEIRNEIDSSLTFRCGCKSGVSGSCAVRVNGKEVLACKTNIKEFDLIEPIRNVDVIKDLVVDVSRGTNLIKDIKSFIEVKSNEQITQSDVEKVDLQSNCILCSSCYSACPLYEVNKDFVGPYILTRAFRYINDKKNSSNLDILNSVQTNGIWDCTLCGLCTFACPQGIDPKSDIQQLQNISVQNGFENQKLASFSMDFNDDFGGFNPNGF